MQQCRPTVRQERQKESFDERLTRPWRKRADPQIFNAGNQDFELRSAFFVRALFGDEFCRELLARCLSRRFRGAAQGIDTAYDKENAEAGGNDARQM